MQRSRTYSSKWRVGSSSPPTCKPSHLGTLTPNHLDAQIDTLVACLAYETFQRLGHASQARSPRLKGQHVAICDWKEKNILFGFFFNCDTWHFVRLPCVLLDLGLCSLRLQSWQTIVVNVATTNATNGIYNVVIWTRQSCNECSHR